MDDTPDDCFRQPDEAPDLGLGYAARPKLSNAPNLGLCCCGVGVSLASHGSAPDDRIALVLSLIAFIHVRGVHACGRVA